jgi:hypothetical protein
VQHRDSARSRPELPRASGGRRGDALTGRGRGLGAGAALLSAALAPWGLAGCRQEQRTTVDEPLDTVDVADSIDSRIRPEEDERAEVRDSAGLLGVLPGDFPSDLWAYEPSSIVDFGDAEPGRSYIALRAIGAPDEVIRRFQSQEGSRGWNVSVVSTTLLTFAKDQRLVEAEIEQRGNETWIRIEYPAPAQ